MKLSGLHHEDRANQANQAQAVAADKDSTHAPAIFRSALKHVTRVSPASILEEGRETASWATQLYPVSAEAMATRPEQSAALPWQPDDPSVYCPQCGCTAGPGSVTADGCSVCCDRRLPWQTVTRLSAYTAPMNQWILQMKYHRQWHWSYWFADRLSETIDAEIVRGIDAVCHVPMHWSRRWRRGYDQSELIARRLARQLGLPFEPLLRRTRRTPKQTLIPRAQRLANVRHALNVSAVDLSGCSVLLVDDVKTSGATLRACSRLLRQAGAKRVDIAVVAVAKE